MRSSPAENERPAALSTLHNQALRALANRLVGYLHGCLRTRSRYDEATAWEHRQHSEETVPEAA